MHVNIALELYGSKQNLEFSFPEGVGLQDLKAVVSEAFQIESTVQRPPGTQTQAVVVEDLELYDPANRRWVRIDERSISQIGSGSQLYVFQPNSIDDQGRIPPARPAPLITRKNILPEVDVIPAISPQKPKIPAPSTPVGAVTRAYPRTLSPDPEPKTEHHYHHHHHHHHHHDQQSLDNVEQTTEPPRSATRYSPEPVQRHQKMQPPFKPVRVVLVFGVSHGTLGEAAVQWLANAAADPSCQHRYTILACGRNEQVLKEFKTQMQAVHFYSIDVLDGTGLEHFANKVYQQHGPPHLILNAVGQSLPPVMFEKMSVSDFDLVLDTMVKGAANICRAFVGMMASSPPGEGYEGVVVNFSSNWGRTAIDGHSALCTAKWAVEGLSKSIAQELPPHVAVIPCNPGAVNTTGLKTLVGPDRATDAPSPADWAAVALPFLLSLSPKDNGRSLTCPGAPTHHYDNALQTTKPMWALGFH